MAEPRRVPSPPDLTVFGEIGGQADVPGYFYFGDQGTLDAYLAQPNNDPYRGIDMTPAPAPPTQAPPLTPEPPLVPVTPPAPPANDPVARKPAPPKVADVPELVVQTPGARAASRALSRQASTSAAAAIFTEVLLPYVYDLFGIRYIPFLGVQPDTRPARRPGGDASGRRTAVPSARGSSAPGALAEVRVTGRRAQPATSVAPATLLAPASAAAILLAANPGFAARRLEDLLPRARPAPRPRPRVVTRPSINPDTLRAARAVLRGPATAPAYNLGQFQPVTPIGNYPAPAPAPAPRPYVPPVVRPDLVTQPGVYAQPQPVAKPALDRCNCEKPKEREPRPPRTVCYSGTYRQLSKGIVYKRGKQIPCAPTGQGTRSSSGLDTLRSATRTLLPSFTTF